MYVDSTLVRMKEGYFQNILCIIFFVLTTFNVFEATIIHGIFQNNSYAEDVHRIFRNSSFSGNSMHMAKQSSVMEVMSKVKQLQDNLQQYKYDDNEVLMDPHLNRLQSAIIKETILDHSLSFSFNTNNINTKKAKNFNDLNKLSRHQHMIDETFRFLDSNFDIKRSITLITDTSDFAQVSMTRIVQKCSEKKRKVSAMLLMSETTSKEEIEKCLTDDLFLVDCKGKLATRMLQIARDVGFTGYVDGVSWIFTERATKSLQLTCALPEGRYFGVKSELTKFDASFMLEMVQKCQNAKIQQNLECERAKHRVKKVTFMQLWNNQRQALEREWVDIKSGIKSLITAQQYRRNPFWPRIKVAVANTFQPWITIVDFEKTDKSEPYCGLNGKYGYRYVNSFTNLTVPICAYGLAVDIVRYLEEKHELIGDIHVSKDGLYGGYNESNGKVTGLVAEIVNGDADIVVDMMEEPSRRKAIEFTQPYEVANHGIAYIKSKHELKAGVFGPFSGIVWAVIMSVIIGLVLLFWALERFSPFGRIQKNKDSQDKNDHVFGISESMEYIWGTFLCGEIIQEKPVATGSRVTSIFISFVFIMIVSVYSANLITSFVVVDETPLITGLVDPKILDEKKGYKIGTQLATATANYLEQHSDVRVRELSQRIKYFATYKESINALESGEIDFFLGDFLTLKHSASTAKDCFMQVIQADSNYAPLALGFKKGSSLKRKLEIVAQSLIKSGEKDRLIKYWFGSKNCQPSNKFDAVTLQNVSTLFIWVSYAACACVGIMILMLVQKKATKLYRKATYAIRPQSSVVVTHNISK